MTDSVVVKFPRYPTHYIADYHSSARLIGTEGLIDVLSNGDRSLSKSRASTHPRRATPEEQHVTKLAQYFQ